MWNARNVIISFSILLKTTGQEPHFDVLIFDEIQKTKNPKTKMTKAVRVVYLSIDGLWSAHRWKIN